MAKKFLNILQTTMRSTWGETHEKTWGAWKEVMSSILSFRVTSDNSTMWDEKVYPRNVAISGLHLCDIRFVSQVELRSITVGKDQKKAKA